MSLPIHYAPGRLSRHLSYDTKHTNTPDEFAFCTQCKINHCHKRFESREATSTMIKDYVESLQYINSCHKLINQIIQCRHPVQNICIPQMPNFLNVLTHLAKDVHGLSDLHNLEILETLMEEMTATGGQSPTRKTSTMGRSSQASADTEDKQVDTGQPCRTNAETSTKTLVTEVRFPATGIPRRIKTKERQPTPFTVGDSSTELRRVDQYKSAVTCVMNAPSSIPKPKNAYMESELELESARDVEVDETSDKDSTQLSNDEMDECAKQLLLASHPMPSAMRIVPSTDCLRNPANKVRRAKSKTRRDSIMIKGFLKKLGVDVDCEVNEEQKSDRPSSMALNCEDVSECSNQVEPHTSPSLPETKIILVADDESDEDNNLKVARSGKIATDSHHMEVLNELAAAAIGLESTFITNEKPVWLVSKERDPSTSDDSDIEPDEHQREHGKVSKPVHSKTVTFQTNPSAAYIVTQRPRDPFLQPRRRKSHSDVGSDHTLVESDIDDEVFDKRRRHKSALRLRAPVLPQKIISNIGILTQTGQVKPEKERHLQELRSRLGTDMQTALFRKPRNRKLETGDIVHLRTDIRM